MTRNKSRLRAGSTAMLSNIYYAVKTTETAEAATARQRIGYYLFFSVTDFMRSKSDYIKLVKTR